MYIAKSNGETIYDHTQRLLDNYKWLKEINYSSYIVMDDKLWHLLEIACSYHDVGKANSYFQHLIGAALQEPVIKNVPHNYLSVFMIPFESIKNANQEFGKEDEAILSQAVGYHHERDKAPAQEDIKEVLMNDLFPKVGEISKHLSIELPDEFSLRCFKYLEKRVKPYRKDLFYKYVMLKGLLHRLDHAASANVKVESCTDYYIKDYVEEFFNNVLGNSKNELQAFAENNMDNHVIAIAQTGMGKTEAGLLWIGKDKGFFTLPLRVSINAMYDRIKDSRGINFPSEEGAVGLLHSSSLDYLEREEQVEDYEFFHKHAQQFSNKLLVTTVDQILKFPFYYRGFEKELSALAGAKVIIDELQSYDPKIAALIIRALEMIDAVGGRFMIMTATMPRLYLEEIQSSEEINRFPIRCERFVSSQVRHQIAIKNNSVLEGISQIVEDSQDNKVLVICNTVGRAVEVYRRLQNEGVEANLLHSLFIQKHRFFLEEEIKEFARSKELKGVWITTQLVEASLDIDFDVLFTEMSILDSLFQRLGRCYRKRTLEHNSPNVYAFTEDVSGKNSIYDSQLLEMSVEKLKPYDNKPLTEGNKMELIEELYSPSNLEGTTFLKSFRKALEFLRNMEPYDINKEEAQRYLRDINNVQVIPRNLFDEISEELLESFKTTKDPGERRRLRREIEQYTLSINFHRVKNYITNRELPRKLSDLFIINLNYEFNTESKVGLNLHQEVKDFIS